MGRGAGCQWDGELGVNGTGSWVSMGRGAGCQWDGELGVNGTGSWRCRRPQLWAASHSAPNPHRNGVIGSHLGSSDPIPSAAAMGQEMGQWILSGPPLFWGRTGGPPQQNGAQPGGDAVRPRGGSVVPLQIFTFGVTQGRGGRGEGEAEQRAKEGEEKRERKGKSESVAARADSKAARRRHRETWGRAVGS